MAIKKSTAILMPNLGLYLDRPPLAIDKRALLACRNVRIKDGRIIRQNMGWDKFITRQLNGTVTGIDNFFTSSGAQNLLFLTTKDVYRYDELTEDVSFLTPREETGTVDVSAADPAIVTGTTTAFDTNGAKPGDKIAFGSTGETDPDATWHEIDTVDSDTQLTLTTAVAGTPLSTQDYTIRKLFTGEIFDWWSFADFPNATRTLTGDGDRWYATNGVDPVIAWDGSFDQVYIPDFDFRCRVLLRWKNMMIYGNLTITSTGEARPFSIRNSAIGEPESISGADESSELVVTDGIEPIVLLMTLGNNLVVYTNRSIVLGEFVGEGLLFVFRTAVGGLGPISGRAVADFGDDHEFIGPDSQYRFDGISTLEIGGHVWRDILRRQSPQRFDLLLSHFDEENGELLWGMPLNSDANPENGPIETAYTEHYLELVGESDPPPFAVRDFPATATGYFSRQTTLTFNQITTAWESNTFRWNDQFFQAAFPFNLFGDADGYVYTLGTSDTQDGADVAAYARFPRRPGYDGKRKGHVRRIMPFAQQHPAEGSELTVRLYGANQEAGPLTLLGDFAYDLTQSTSKYFVSPRKEARFFEIEFRTETSGVPWFLDGYDMDIVPGGER